MNISKLKTADWDIKKRQSREIAFVPRTGIEPALPCDNQILSLARLPIPPSGLFSSMHECNVLRQGIVISLC